jgi:hypothetical protein
MKKKFCEKDLWLYQAGLLTGSELRKAEEHIASCPECRISLASFTIAIAKMSTAGNHPAPATLDEKILGSIRSAEEDRTKKQSGLSMPRLVPVLVVALVLIVSGVLYWSMSERSLGVLSVPFRADLNNRPVHGQTRIYARASLSADSACLITKPRFYIIKCDENCLLTLSRPENSKFRVRLDSASAEFDIVKNSCAFSVSTFNAEISVTGTRFRVTANPVAGTTRINLLEGTVRVTDNSGVPETSTMTAPSTRIIVSRRIAAEATASDSPVVGQKVVSGIQKVYLRDGSIFIGTQIRQLKGESFIETKAGVIRVNDRDIEKVEYLH